MPFVVVIMLMRINIQFIGTRIAKGDDLFLPEKLLIFL